MSEIQDMLYTGFLQVMENPASQRFREFEIQAWKTRKCDISFLKPSKIGEIFRTEMPRQGKLYFYKDLFQFHPIWSPGNL